MLSSRGAFNTRSFSGLDLWIVHAWQVFDLWIVLAWSLKNGEVFWTHTPFFSDAAGLSVLLSAAVERAGVSSTRDF